MGVSLVPAIPRDSKVGGLVNSLVNKIIYLDILQQFIAPSNYWKNPENREGYLKNAKFLPISNNELVFNSTKKEIWLSLKFARFIKFTEDKIIVPKESSWWGEYSQNFTELTRFQTKLYKEDLLGIRTLEETGKADFLEFNSEHMIIDNGSIVNYVQDVVRK